MSFAMGTFFMLLSMAEDINDDLQSISNDVSDPKSTIENRTPISQQFSGFIDFHTKGMQLVEFR